jgi:5,10-methylenetetrahydromethanopterin reductase
VTDDRRLGLLFAGAPRVPEMVALARRAEAKGFDSVWMAETRMTRDGFVPLAAMATATSRIRLGTGIVNVYTRGAVVMAISFATLAELAPGRTIVGLGPGSPKVLAPQGYPWERPLTRLREYTDVMRPLLRGEAVTYEGRTVQLDGAQIEDVLAGEGGSIGAGDLPIWFGVTGMRAVELAGEQADGVLYNVGLPTAYVERARAALEAGAARSGRDPDRIETGMGIVTSPHHDSATGRERAHRFLSLYLSLFPNIAQETGLDAELLEATRAAFHDGGVGAAVRVLPEWVVDVLGAAGTPAECQERLDAYRAAGIDVPVLIALDDSLPLAIDTLR